MKSVNNDSNHGSLIPADGQTSSRSSLARTRVLRVNATTPSKERRYAKMCLRNVHLHSKQDKTFGEDGNTRSVIFLRSARLKIEIEIKNNPTIKILLHYYILYIFIWLLYFYLWFETRDSSNMHPYISPLSALLRFQKSGQYRTVHPGYSEFYIFYTSGESNYAEVEFSHSIWSSIGCRVGERVYIEGEMVRDIEWKAACDNCFCAMGAIRCVPLACAPPLQGCSPIVREGQCCPSTYNCSEFHANSHSGLSHAHTQPSNSRPDCVFRWINREIPWIRNIPFHFQAIIKYQGRKKRNAGKYRNTRPLMLFVISW